MQDKSKIILKKLIIRPYVHNRISDDSSLKTGLRAMFENVDVC